jgi:hypothetical protein
MFNVVSKTVWYTTKCGKPKYKYVLTGDITALHWEGLAHPIVYDTQLADKIERYKWYINRSGNAQKGNIHMHHLVVGETVIDTSQRVVHLNGHKLDNRTINLHLVETRGILNDRTERADKKPPPQQLVDEGICQLPRFVRWDNSEHKFIIQNHPTLHRDVENKLRNKPILSGTKASKVSIVEKYQDIMAKLQELNKKCPTFDESKLVVREQLSTEYLAISDAIRQFDEATC